MTIYEDLNLENINDEIWKEIEGYNGDYFISNYGRIKSFKGKEEKILEQSKNNYNGYVFVRLYKNGKGKTKYIHILMYESFNNYKLKKNECIHHINFTKDNRLDNFQLMLKSDHIGLHHKNKIISEKTKELIKKNHADFKGKNHPMFGKKRQGELSGNHKLKEWQVKSIYQISNSPIIKQLKITQEEIANIFEISQDTVSRIKNSNRWKHLRDIS